MKGCLKGRRRAVRLVALFFTLMVLHPPDLAVRAGTVSDREAAITREIWSLAENWMENRKAILANLDAPDPVRRRVAINAMPLEVSAGDAAMVVPLILDPDVSVSTAAINRFLDWRLDSAVPNLAQVLEMENLRRRRTAAMALSLQCSQSAFKVLDAYVESGPEEEVLVALERGLSDVICTDRDMERRKASIAVKVRELLDRQRP